MSRSLQLTVLCVTFSEIGLLPFTRGVTFRSERERAGPAESGADLEPSRHREEPHLRVRTGVACRFLCLNVSVEPKSARCSSGVALVVVFDGCGGFAGRRARPGDDGRARQRPRRLREAAAGERRQHAEVADDPAPRGALQHCE